MDGRELLERQVLWVCGHQDIGIAPGSYMTFLISAVLKADWDNEQRLAAVYPGVVATCIDFAEGDLLRRYRPEGLLM